MTDPRRGKVTGQTEVIVNTDLNVLANLGSSIPHNCIGNYRLLERLGEGGMGEVYRAEHIKLGRTVALKLIRPDRLRTPEAIKRFTREVRAAARVDHPFIVRSFDAGSEGQHHFLVMELVDGIDLHSLIQKDGRLSIPAVLRIALEIAMALQHLHVLGMVHRDLKPTNLIRSKQTGSVKLLDLGLARFEFGSIPDDQTQSMTMRGVVLGTPDFMAPEQAQNAKAADIRADLYSLGCTLYFLLAGDVPFPGGTPIEKLFRQQEDEPTPLRQIRPDLPIEIESIVNRLMAKNPNSRFQTPADLITHLKRLAESPSTAPSLQSKTGTSVTRQDGNFWREQFSDWLTQDSTLTEASEKTVPVQPKRRRIWLAGSVFSLGMLLLIAGLLTRKPPQNLEPDTKQDQAKTTTELQVERSRLYQQVIKRTSTSESINAAKKLSELRSPLDELPAPTTNASSLQLGDKENRHSGWIRSIDVTPDGKWFVTGGWDRVVRLWNAQSMKIHRLFRAHQTPVWRVAISPDARFVCGVSGFDGPLEHTEGLERSVRLWDATSGFEVLKIDFDNSGWAISAIFSPDGKKLLVGQYDVASLWDLETMTKVREVRADGMNWSSGVGFSRDGKHVFTGGAFQEQVRVFETETGKFKRSFSSNRSFIEELIPSRLNDTLLEVSEGRARIWDWTTGKQIREFRSSTQAVRAACWSEDHREAIIAWSDSSIEWFPLESDNPSRKSSLPGLTIRDLAILPNSNRLLVATDEGKIRQLDGKTGNSLDQSPIQGSVWELKFVDRDTRLAILRTPGFAELVGVPKGNRIKASSDVELHGKSVSMKGHLFGLDASKNGLLWDLSTNRVKLVTSNEKNDIATTRLLGNDCVIEAWGRDRVVRLRELREKGNEKAIQLESEVRSVATAIDERLVAFGTQSGQLVIYRLPDLEEVQQIKIGASVIRAVEFTPDGETLYALADKNLWKVQVKMGSFEAVTGLEGQFLCMAISADGEMIAVGNFQGEVLVFPLGKSSRQRKIRLSGPISSLAFSTDRACLAVGQANGAVDLYRLRVEK
jgi:serine/threonine protein kinase/WD40 repeat protein